VARFITQNDPKEPLHCRTADAGKKTLREVRRHKSKGIRGEVGAVSRILRSEISLHALLGSG